jgi:hypothetical protein
VWNYISGVRDAHARLGKFKFLRTLFEYDNFVPLSLPLLPQSIPTLDPDLLLEQHMYVHHLSSPSPRPSTEALLRGSHNHDGGAHRKQHFFVGLLIREIASTVDEPKSLRAQVPEFPAIASAKMAWCGDAHTHADRSLSVHG